MAAIDGESAWPRARAPSASLAAVATWLVAAPVGIAGARALDYDPLTVGGAVFPVGVGVVLLAAGVALAALRPAAWVAGACAGLFAGWLAFLVAAALQGAPYGYGRLTGDFGRLMAFATRLETNWGSVDQIVPSVPSEYPPLYPWLLARAAELADVPVWKLFKVSQPLLFSAAVVIGFVLWRRLVPAWTALLVAGLGPLLHPNPGKDYEVVLLVAFLPWALATFAHDVPAERRLPWYVAGVVAGLTLLTYQAYLVFAGIGLVALVVRGLLGSERRDRYLAHVGGVVAVSFVLASWYVVPYLARLATDGRQRMSEQFLSGGIVSDPVVMPFLDATPLGVLQLVGLVGAAAYAGRRWWAVPTLLLLAGTYAYQAYFLLGLASTGYTGFLHYANPLVSALLLGAAALTLAEVFPLVASRMNRSDWPRPHQAAALLPVAALLAWAGLTLWDKVMPAPHGLRDAESISGEPNLAAYAHAEPLSDGRAPPGAPSRRLAGVPLTGFPADQIEAEIRERLGPDASPVVLSYDQRLFSFHPFAGYVSPKRTSANSLQRWDDRAGAVRELASIRDPNRFARAARETAFGPIDVFVLRDQGDAFSWQGIRFDPGSFSTHFDVVRGLPNGTVVAIRRA